MLERREFGLEIPTVKVVVVACLWRLSMEVQPWRGGAQAEKKREKKLKTQEREKREVREEREERRRKKRPLE